MNIQIRTARAADYELIRTIQIDLKRPQRDDYRADEFLIAWEDKIAVGCAATSLLPGGGYFYGLAVRREWQRMGVGSKLMNARLDSLQTAHGGYAVALVMFWNSRFFRAHGFSPIKRSELPRLGASHIELTKPAFRRSAVMVRSLNELS